METQLLKLRQVFVNPEFEAFFTKLEKEQVALAGIAGRLVKWLLLQKSFNKPAGRGGNEISWLSIQSSTVRL